MGFNLETGDFEEEVAYEKNKVSGGGNKKVIIFLLLVIVILSGTAIYFLIKNNMISSDFEKAQKELNTTYLRLDSISIELDKRIATISQLGGDVESLKKEKEKLIVEKRNLLTKVNSLDPEKMKSLKEQVNGLKELLLAKDQEIEKLKIANEQLALENNDLKIQTQSLTDSITGITEVNKSLSDQVFIASQLKAADFFITAIQANGKERTKKIKNKHVAKLKIKFDVLENNVAPIEGKDLYIRLITPTGAEIFDVANGSGSFKFEGREINYTIKKEILYDRNKQTITVMYDKTSDFATGLHVVEVYAENYLLGQGSFIITD